MRGLGLMLTALMLLAAREGRACSVSTEAMRTLPADGQVVGPDTRIALELSTNVYSETRANLTDPYGEPVALEHVEDAYMYILGYVQIYKPRQELEPGEYRLSFSYLAELGTTTTPTTSFTVKKRPPREKIVTIGDTTWNLGSADVFSANTCVSAIEMHAITVRADRTPTWYEVQASGAYRNPERAASHGPPILRRFIAPNDPFKVEFLSPFEVDCVWITPMGLDGALGDTVVDCQPERCSELMTDERGWFDPPDLDLGAPCTQRNLSVPAQPPFPIMRRLVQEPAGCRCNSPPRGALWWLLPALLIVLAPARARA